MPLSGHFFNAPLFRRKNPIVSFVLHCKHYSIEIKTKSEIPAQAILFSIYDVLNYPKYWIKGSQ